MSPFSIGFDIRMIRHTGIGTYIRELLSSMVEWGVAKRHKLAFFGGEPLPYVPKEISQLAFRSAIYSIGEQLEYPVHLERCRLWHSPHYNIPWNKKKTRLVATVHDLIHWIFRGRFFNSVQGFYAGAMLRRAVRECDHIIAVSERTRNDLLRHFHADPDKVSVIHESVNECFRKLPPDAIESVRIKYRLPESFFLYLGSLKPHKNVLWLARIYQKLRAQKKIHSSLVLVGRKDRRYPKGFEDLASVEKMNSGIFYLPEVEYGDTIALYSAFALIAAVVFGTLSVHPF